MASNNQGQQVEAPSDFVCPISHEIMEFPLMTKAGLSFERDCILRWLEEHGGTCPITRQPLTPGQLVSNRALVSKIAVWRQANGVTNATSDANDDHDYDTVKKCFYIPSKSVPRTPKITLATLSKTNGIIVTPSDNLFQRGGAAPNDAHRNYLAQILELVNADVLADM